MGDKGLYFCEELFAKSSSSFRGTKVYTFAKSSSSFRGTKVYTFARASRASRQKSILLRRAQSLNRSAAQSLKELFVVVPRDEGLYFGDEGLYFGDEGLNEGLNVLP